MMVKKLTAALLALTLLLSLAACSSKTDESTKASEAPAQTTQAPASTSASTQPAATEPAPTAPPATEAAEITVTDMIGRELTIKPGSYQKIVCIGAGALRMFCYIGDVNLLCGVEDIDNESLAERPKMFDSVARPYVLAYSDVFRTLPSCGVGGPNAQAAEAEKILACSPDLVISEYEDVDKENALQEQLGVPVVTLKTGPEGVFADAFKGSMRLLGTIFGKEERAEELIAFIDKERAEIESRTAGVADADKPAVYLCGLGNWGTTNHLMTAQNFINLKVANVKNVVTDLASPGIQAIEAEKFIALGDKMDIMIMDAAAVKNIKPLYQQDPTMFDFCKAWQNGEVYLEMAYNAYYTNYELALLNTWFIAQTVYPELFTDLDMTAKTNEVTKMFLGTELADAIFAKPVSFGGYQKIDTKTFFN